MLSNISSEKHPETVMLLRVALNKVNGQILKYQVDVSGPLILFLFFYTLQLQSQLKSGQKLLPTASMHTLTSKDLSQVTAFLAELSNGELVELGLELGLHYRHLERMRKPSQECGQCMAEGDGLRDTN